MVNVTEEIAAKGMGKIKHAKARAQGLRGVFVQLAEEHGEAAALLDRGLASSDLNKVKTEIFPELRRELLSHERGELDELYPTFEPHPEIRALAQEHAKEAGEMEALIRELTDGNLSDEDWRSTFSRLADAVKQHAETEEESYFPRAQEALGEATAEHLRERYLQRKQVVLKELP